MSTQPPVVDVQDVSLDYRTGHGRGVSMKEHLVSLGKGRRRQERLRALDGVSFQLRAGEVLGVIGANGAGKSSLMKVVARVLPPTGGRVVVRGDVSPMIELGAGFNPELTGLENIVLYGTILGRSPRSMRERAPAIAAWADLDAFLHAPLRTYSSGMLVRLGFSVAVDVRPDLLVVDEVLSVGDEAFKRKSQARIDDMIAAGTAVLLVSHALDTVQRTCDRVLWLDHGRTKVLGEPESTVAAYRASV